MDKYSKGILLAVAAVAVAGLLAVEVTYWFLADDSGEDDLDYTLTIGFLQQVDSLNPNVGLNQVSYFLYSLLYDPLMTVDQDLNPVGDLARSWWIVPESDPGMEGMPYGSVWQYNLTQNASWTDGEAFTADDVVFTLNLNAQSYDWMWAYQPYAYFMQQAEKVDNYTVRVSFWDRATGDPKPVSYAYMMPIPMMPYHKLQSMGPDDISFLWTGVFLDEETPIVGTGPFKATDSIWSEWLGGDNITLVKNPNHHWMRDRSMETEVDRIRLLFFDDPTAMTLALKNREIDVAEFPSATFMALKDDIQAGEVKDLSYYSGLSPTGDFTYIGFNLENTTTFSHKNNATRDPSVRTALAMATDKSWIIDTYLLDLADVGSSLVSPIWTKWYYEPSESELIEYNLSAAAALLEAAGYQDINSDGIREATDSSLSVQEGWVTSGTQLLFDMPISRDNIEEKEIAGYLESEWIDIGVVLDWRVVDETILPLCTSASTCMGEQPDLTMNRWTGDPDPNFILFTQSSAALYGWSDMWYNNTSYDENYSSFVSSFNCSDRCAFAKECQRIHYLDAAYNVLAYPHQKYVWRNDTFVGWGDWDLHPGLSLDCFWGGNAILYSLSPIEITCPCVDYSIQEGLAVAATSVAFVVLLWASLRLRWWRGEKGAGQV